MATDGLPTIPMEITPAVPPEGTVAILGDVFFSRADAVVMLKAQEKRFQAKAREAETADDFRGANDQAEACAKVCQAVAHYNPEKAGGKLLDLGEAVEKERDKLREAREAG
jgi:hypothetical protein